MHTLRIPDVGRKQTNFLKPLCPKYSLFGSADLCGSAILEEGIKSRWLILRKKIRFLQNTEKGPNRQLEILLCANMT